MPGFRKHVRSLETFVVEIFNEDFGAVQVKTKDISKEGMFVKSQDLQKLISIGDAVSARVLSHDDDKREGNTQMRAVRSTIDGIAFAFE